MSRCSANVCFFHILPTLQRSIACKLEGDLEIIVKGSRILALCSARSTSRVPLGKPRKRLPQRKIGVTSKTPVGVISVVTLIRTDTTLDHSQKAEKVCYRIVGEKYCQPGSDKTGCSRLSGNFCNNQLWPKSNCGRKRAVTTMAENVL